jgi:hypothetical protein
MAIAEMGYERRGGLSGAVSGRWAAGKTRFDGSKTRRKSCRDDQVSPEQEVSMSQVDPWEKAADCERALRITVDPVYRETLSNIREFWIALAHESRFLSDEALATQIETIGRLHAKFDRDAHA